MLTHSHVGLLPGAATPAASRDKTPIVEAAWRYHSPKASIPRLLVAMFLAVLVHGGFVAAIHPYRKAKPKPAEVPTIALTITMNVSELEELDPVPVDDTAPPIDLSTIVPMQADVPQIAAPSDFVQRVDYASLIERPDLTAAKVMVIPENINRGAQLARRIGTIFNISDLDRIPVATFQTPPVFPQNMKREAESAVVKVEFIVDTQGNVLNPVAIESTNTGFNDAAVHGVGKWKFRPGFRGGRRVNTRMQVPIVFKIVDGA
ncbi:MAG: energy transducer TonB [Opitutaceae bacterium]|nr:energy transducer TonB [Opitutaceae bacterium]